VEYEVRVSDERHAISLHHALGEKYSLALVNWCNGALKSIPNIKPKIERSKNSITIRFNSPLRLNNFSSESPDDFGKRETRNVVLGYVKTP
jgi:hypothetical protein